MTVHFHSQTRLLDPSPILRACCCVDGRFSGLVPVNNRPTQIARYYYVVTKRDRNLLFIGSVPLYFWQVAANRMPKGRLLLILENCMFDYRYASSASNNINFSSDFAGPSRIMLGTLVRRRIAIEFPNPPEGSGKFLEIRCTAKREAFTFVVQ